MLHVMLRSLDEKEKPYWSDHLQELLIIYNATPHELTDSSPHLLMFRKEADLPLDFLLGKTTEAVYMVAEHIEWLREAHKRAGEWVKKITEERKRKANEKLPSQLI